MRGGLDGEHHTAMNQADDATRSRGCAEERAAMLGQAGPPPGPRRSAAGFALALVLAVVTGFASAVVEDWRSDASSDAAAPRKGGMPCLLLVEASCTPQPSAAASE
jgi:ferric-dicitrate binding protein FerR (iron transport regulator)